MIENGRINYLRIEKEKTEREITEKIYKEPNTHHDGGGERKKISAKTKNPNSGEKKSSLG